MKHQKDTEITLEDGSKTIAYPHIRGGMVNSQDCKTRYVKLNSGRYKIENQYKNQ